jgi:cytoskeletal protein CcmA (bactofilin family)
MKIGTSPENEIGTVVGANVRLQGTLRDTNDITVHGVVEGEVISDKTVTITATSAIKGPVSADTIIVAGSVKGSVEAKTKLEILSTGKVNGSITTAKSLIIHDGATFNGKSVMSETENSPAPQAATHIESDKETSNKSKPDSQFELE